MTLPPDPPDDDSDVAEAELAEMEMDEIFDELVLDDDPSGAV